MVNRSYILACSAMLLLSSEVFAWRGANAANTSAEEPAMNYPLNDNQQGYTRESYLIWKPYEDDIDFADRFVREDLTDSSTVITDRFKHPKFEWSSGVRVAIGKYLPNHDQWDLSLIGTYYYNDADRHAKANPRNREGLANLFMPSFTLGSNIEVSGHLQMNYFTTDFLIGRYFTLTDNVQLHPYIGARAAFIYQDYHEKLETNSTLTSHFKFKADHNHLGAGPRIGTDFSYGFGHGWAFLANLSAAFLYGRYTLSEKLGGFIFAPLVQPLRYKVKDADTTLRSNIEGSIGLQWEKWVRGHTVRIAPSFQVEFSEWFAVKRWVDTHSTSSRITANNDLNLQSRRRYGDLGLFGFNINLHVDF